MATINDVADAAGVSTSTVSYVLSGKRPISAATRARVESAIVRPARASGTRTGRRLPEGVPVMGSQYRRRMPASVRTAATHGGTPPGTARERGVLSQGGDVPRVRSAPR